MPAPPRLRGSVGSLTLLTGPSPGCIPLSLNCPWQSSLPSSLQHSHQPWAVYTGPVCIQCYLYVVLSTPGLCVSSAVYTWCCLHLGCVHSASTPGVVCTLHHAGCTPSLPSSSLSADRKCLQGDILSHQETPGWPTGTGGQRPPQHSLQGSPLPQGKCCLSLPPSGFPVPATPAAEGQRDKEC